jgi:hypothetical protein
VQAPFKVVAFHYQRSVDLSLSHTLPGRADVDEPRASRNRLNRTFDIEAAK